MCFNVYGVYYSQYSHQHVSATIAVIFRVILLLLLLQEYKRTNVVLVVILYFVGFSSSVIFICIVYFNIYFKKIILKLSSLCVHWFKNFVMCPL